MQFIIQAKATNWPTTWPTTWKVSDMTVAKEEGGGVLEQEEVLMVAPVPFCTVIDSLDTGIHTLDMLECLSSLTDAETEPYIQNAIK